MLFVTFYIPKPQSTPEQSLKRRMDYKEPEGIKQVAEYWLQQSTGPQVLTVCEAEEIGPIMAACVPWMDLFDVTVIPAISAEDGLTLVRKMMS